MIVLALWEERETQLDITFIMKIHKQGQVVDPFPYLLNWDDKHFLVADDKLSFEWVNLNYGRSDIFFMLKRKVMSILKKKSDNGNTDSLTVIGNKTFFEGRIKAYDIIHIDGTIKGNIECQGV